MGSRPERPRDEAWTVFGRWRRRSPAVRRLGIALLALALLLTLIWARTPRGDGAAVRPPAPAAVAAPIPPIVPLAPLAPLAPPGPAQGA